MNVSADGSLPPEPYNWLHPPPALAGSNGSPQSGKVILPLRKGRSRAGYGFTGDGQAGIVAKSGTFQASSQAKTVQVLIKPVEEPGQLPGQLLPDGNAYSLVATEHPGGRRSRVGGGLTVVFRFPYAPTGVYLYRRGSWHRVCGTGQAVITPTTISCATSALGTFLVVHAPAGKGGPLLGPSPAGLSPPKTTPGLPFDELDSPAPCRPRDLQGLLPRALPPDLGVYARGQR